MGSAAAAVAQQPGALQNAPAYARPVQPRWSSVVQPGYPYQKLSSQDKLINSIRENFRYTSLVPLFFSSGVSQGLDSAPHYGVDKGAFGERLGATALREASMRFLADGVMPSLLREDPRYYRMVSGRYLDRGLYAASRAVISHRDSGGTGVNYASISGHLFAMALTAAYYPPRDRNAQTVFQGAGLSLVGSAVNDEFLEFLPDLLHLVHHRRAGALAGEPKPGMK